MMPDTALHTAITNEKSLPEIAAILTSDAKIDINAVDEQKKTALTLAVATKQYKVAMYLFRRHASITAAFLPEHQGKGSGKVESILRHWLEPWIEWVMTQLAQAKLAMKYKLHQDLFNLRKGLSNCLLKLEDRGDNCLYFCRIVIGGYSETMKPPFANNAESETYLKSHYELLQFVLQLDATCKYFDDLDFIKILDSFFFTDLEKMLVEKSDSAKLATLMKFYQHCDRYDWEHANHYAEDEEGTFIVRNQIYKGILHCFEAGKPDEEKQAPTAAIMQFSVAKAYVNRARNYFATEDYSRGMADLDNAQRIFATIPLANRSVVECPLRNLLDFDAEEFSWNVLLGDADTVAHFSQADYYERLQASQQQANSIRNEELWELTNYHYAQSITRLEQTIADFCQDQAHLDQASFVRLHQQRQLLLASQKENYANYLYDANSWSYKVTFAWRASALISLMQSLHIFEKNRYGFDRQLKAVSANIKTHVHSASDEDYLLVKLVDFINYIVKKLAHSERYILCFQEDTNFTRQSSYISDGLIALKKLRGEHPSANLTIYQQLYVSVQDFLAEKKETVSAKHPDAKPKLADLGDDESDEESYEESDEEKQKSVKIPRLLGKKVRSRGSAWSIHSSEFTEYSQSSDSDKEAEDPIPLSLNMHRTDLNAGSRQPAIPNPDNPPTTVPRPDNPHGDRLRK